MIPLPYLPAPVRVVELDVCRPLTAIAGCAGYQALRILVRLDSVPIGWVTIEHPPDEVSPELLNTALSRDLKGAIIRRVAEEDLTAPGRERSGPQPAISVVVCTRDRTGSLERCLASLLALDYPQFEVIVVDNAPSSDASARLAATRPVRYVREDRPGLDWARNRGIVEARHAIIAFTDDDVRVDRGWLQAVADGFANPATMLMTGLIAPAELETPAQINFEFSYGGMAKGFHAWVTDPAVRTPPTLLGAHHLGAGANMAYRRDIFDRVGLFDTALDVGTPSHGGGDLDMFYRVMASGAVARYHPAALVWHAHRRELSALRRQLRDNGRAFGVYLITRWVEGKRGAAGVSPRAVVRYALFTWLSWMATRVVRRLRRRETLSLPLQLEEILGACESPWAYLATRRADARQRRMGSALERLQAGH